MQSQIILTIADVISGFLADWIAKGRIDLAVVWRGDSNAAPEIVAEIGMTARRDLP